MQQPVGHLLYKPLKHLAGHTGALGTQLIERDRKESKVPVEREHADARVLIDVPFTDLDEPSVSPDRFFPQGDERAGAWTSLPADWRGLPAERLEGEETLKVVRQVLDGLPPMQAEVLLDVRADRLAEVEPRLGADDHGLDAFPLVLGERVHQGLRGVHRVGHRVLTRQVDRFLLPQLLGAEQNRSGIGHRGGENVRGDAADHVGGHVAEMRLRQPGRTEARAPRSPEQ